MKRYFIFCLIFLLCVLGEVGEAGTRGLSSLKIGVGGRVVGMGEAFSAVSVGAISAYWNPAGLIETDIHELVTAHNKWLFDVRTALNLSSGMNSTTGSILMNGASMTSS